jgi:hypothetical protein
VAAAVTSGIFLLTLIPSGGALHIHSVYYTQCFGTQQGTVIPSQHGRTSGGVWGGNYSNGSLTLSNESASGAPNSYYSTLGWISMGPGPSNGLCFTPSSATSNLTYSFSNISYSVHLQVYCNQTSPHARASYNFSLDGNIYDFSAGAFVWGSTLFTHIGKHAVSCAAGSPHSFAHTYFLHGPIYVRGSTSSLSTSDKYWFIVVGDLKVRADAHGTNNSASAVVSGVSMTLSGIHCPNC